MPQSPQTDTKWRDVPEEGSSSAPSGGWIDVPEFNALSENSDQGMAAGAVRNVKDTWKGMKALVAPASKEEEGAASKIPIPIYRAGKGMLDSMKSADAQSQLQWNRKQYGRSIVSGIASLNPLAAGPVSRINDLVDQGKLDEAAGSGIVDALSLGISYVLGKKADAPTREATLNRMSYATGESKNAMMAERLPRIANEVADHIEKNGLKPKGIRDLNDIFQDIRNGKNGEVAGGLQKLQGQHFFPVDTANGLTRLRNEYSLHVPSAERDAAITKINMALNKFKNPMTYEQARAELQQSMDSKRFGQVNPNRTGVDEAIENTVHDSMGRSLDRGLERATGKPFDYWQDLRKQQADFIEVHDFTKGRQQGLEALSRSQKGAPLRSSVKPHVYATPGGLPRAHIAGLGSVAKGTELGAVNKAVTRMAAPSRVAQVSRAATAAAPALTPPPSSEPDE